MLIKRQLVSVLVGCPNLQTHKLSNSTSNRLFQEYFDYMMIYENLYTNVCFVRFTIHAKRGSDSQICQASLRRRHRCSKIATGAITGAITGSSDGETCWDLANLNAGPSCVPFSSNRMFWVGKKN